MQDPFSFGVVLSNLCKKITGRAIVHHNSDIIMNIGSSDHSYMLDIQEKCNLKVGI